MKIHPTVQAQLDDVKFLTKMGIVHDDQIIHVFLKEWPEDKTTVGDRRRFADAIGGELVTLTLELQVIGVNNVHRLRKTDQSID